MLETCPLIHFFDVESFCVPLAKASWAFFWWGITRVTAFVHSVLTFGSFCCCFLFVLFSSLSSTGLTKSLAGHPALVRLSLARFDREGSFQFIKRTCLVCVCFFGCLVYFFLYFWWQVPHVRHRTWLPGCVHGNLRQLPDVAAENPIFWYLSVPSLYIIFGDVFFVLFLCYPSVSCIFVKICHLFAVQLRQNSGLVKHSLCLLRNWQKSPNVFLEDKNLLHSNLKFGYAATVPKLEEVMNPCCGCIAR